MRALDAALGTPWAMQPSALETLLEIASRDSEPTAEVLEKYRAEAVDRAETLERRGDVAILSVVGPLFRRANLFTEISGATSYDKMMRDLQVALDDTELRAIVLNVDSPGGDANGVGELAKAIHAARQVKPVVAYVGGAAASGGYWIASAASEVVVDEAAILGSIGVVLGATDTKARDEAQGVRRFEIVSSQSPGKRPDPGSEDGRGQMQRLADDLADVFIEAVARHRGVTAETVLSDFGQGGLLVGQKAVAAGMADRVGTFEDTLHRLQSGGRSPGRPSIRSTTKGTVMSDNEGPNAGDENAEAKAEAERQQREAVQAAVKADRERRATVLALDEAKGREGLAEHLLASTEMGAEDIKAALAAAPAPAAAAPEEEEKVDEAEYERARVSGAGLGGEPPRKSAQPTINTREIYAARKQA